MQQSQSILQVPELTQQQVSLNEAADHPQDAAPSIPPVKLAQMGALLSLGSAAVHVLAAEQFSQDWWGYGGFFLLLAGFQSLYASVLLRFPGPAVFLIGISVNVLITLLLLSALSFGIDSVRLVTVTSSIVEISLILTLVVLWWTGCWRKSQPDFAVDEGESSPGSRNPPAAYPADNSPTGNDSWPVEKPLSGIWGFAVRKMEESKILAPLSQGPITRLKHMGLREAIYWVLRIACGLNFMFHGAWGVVGKEVWLPFFDIANIGGETAWVLQPWVGVMDISLGLVVLFAPTRWALVWMTVWAVWTALLRPLSGSEWWYFLERSGNYGPPLALLLYAGRGKSVMDWIMPFHTPVLTRVKIDIIIRVLRVSIAAQLIAHGLYGVIEGKQILIDHFASVGLPGGLMDPESFLITVGWIEIGAGLMILFKPVRALLGLVVIWEVFLGLLFPISGLPASDHPQAYLIFRTLERFGDYAGPFGILLLMAYGPMWKKDKTASEEEKASEGVPAATRGAVTGAATAAAAAGND